MKAKKSRNKKTLTIKLSKWGQNYLLTESGRRCCLGFMAQAAGVRAAACTGVGMPESLYDEDEEKFTAMWGRTDYQWFKKAAEINDTVVGSDLDDNDNVRFKTREAKQAALRKFFAKHKIALRFVP